MATITTPTVPKAWAPDVVGVPATEAVPTALLVQVGVKAGVIEGDEPSLRVPFMAADGTVSFVPEATPIPEQTAVLDEVVIQTHKLAVHGKYSRESLEQPNAARLIVDSMQRALIRKADEAFLSNLADPTGLLNVTGITDGGAVGANLDELVDAVVSIEADGGQATHIIAAPGAWGTLSKIKSGVDSAVSLLGAGTEATERRLLGIPVHTTSAMPAGTLLVCDASSIVTVYGEVMPARSSDVFFLSDVVAVRVMWRIGWGVMRPARLVGLTTV